MGFWTLFYESHTWKRLLYTRILKMLQYMTVFFMQSLQNKCMRSSLHFPHLSRPTQHFLRSNDALERLNLAFFYNTSDLHLPQDTSTASLKDARAATCFSRPRLPRR